MSEEATRTDTAEERPEQTEERTARSDGTLSSGSLSFDERIQEVRGLREAVREGEPGSTFLFDEAGATGGRRERAAAGEDFALRMGQRGLGGGSSATTGGYDDALPSTSSVGTPDPFGPSRRDLAQRLDRLEGKVDALLAALDLDVGDGGRDE